MGFWALMGAKRVLITSQAFNAACHTRSPHPRQRTALNTSNECNLTITLDSEVPLPPVMELAGVESVLVGTTVISDMSTPSFHATACATFVYRPWPISQPLVDSSMVPSLG